MRFLFFLFMLAFFWLALWDHDRESEEYLRQHPRDPAWQAAVDEARHSR